MIGKLEEKARELVAEVDKEERRRAEEGQTRGRKRAEALKNLKKTERGVNEYMYRSNEDNRNSERITLHIILFKAYFKFQDLIDSLRLLILYDVQAQERAGETMDSFY
jgi:hypothetical protein